MRVQYTLPGLQPKQPDHVEGAVTSPSFKSRVRRLSQVVPRGWKQLLRLDVPSVGLEFLAPPPPVESAEVIDAGTHRYRWREMLDRQARLYGEGSGREEEPEVQRMLSLLLNYQMMEDHVASRQLAENQG